MEILRQEILRLPMFSASEAEVKQLQDFFDLLARECGKGVHFEWEVTDRWFVGTLVGEAINQINFMLNGRVNLVFQMVKQELTTFMEVLKEKQKA